MADVLTRGDLFSPCLKASIFPLKTRGTSSSSSSCCLRSSLTLGSSFFRGKRLVAEGLRLRPVNGKASACSVRMAFVIGKAMRWWEKGVQPNMREFQSAQDLVDSLASVGDKLVVVDFFSPGCGGCKALHPKICQIAEQNPDVDFLQINYEEHKSMCYSLNVHVLPFFRLYRGAHGRVCSFSCTNATIKKFRDALAKHNTDRCSLGPAKGLEEKELLALAANKELGFSYTPKPEPEAAAAGPKYPAFPVSIVGQGSGKVLTAAGI